MLRNAVVVILAFAVSHSLACSTSSPIPASTSTSTTNVAPPSQWSPWSPCSSSCGAGTTSRSRDCPAPGSGACPVPRVEHLPCQLESCLDFECLKLADCEAYIWMVQNGDKIGLTRQEVYGLVRRARCDGNGNGNDVRVSCPSKHDLPEERSKSVGSNPGQRMSCIGSLYVIHQQVSDGVPHIVVYRGETAFKYKTRKSVYVRNDGNCCWTLNMFGSNDARILRPSDDFIGTLFLKSFKKINCPP